MIDSREAGDRAIFLLEKRWTDAADLYWLAFLLTGRHYFSFGVASGASVSQAWSRRIVIAKALALIRAEFAESARWTELASEPKVVLPAPAWSLSPDTTKKQIEEALLAIDVFPRAAVIVSIFEGIRIAHAATILDVDSALVGKGRAIGLRELTANLARKHFAAPVCSLGWRGLTDSPNSSAA